MHILAGVSSAAAAALAGVLLGIYGAKKEWFFVILWGLILVLQAFSAVVQLMFL